VPKFESFKGLDGVWSRSLSPKLDERGYFIEGLRNYDLPENVDNFVQDSYSFSKKNVLRGMHIQLKQWQLITIIEGSIVDVLINLERTSGNFLKSASFTLSWDGLNQILVAPGFAHGFAVISDTAKIHYKSSVYYGSTEQFGIRWDSPEIIGYWPGLEWTISQRDQEFPSSKEISI
jgi:dTDP-4-dehydrorhamnose 3,5-epimerase